MNKLLNIWILISWFFLGITFYINYNAQIERLWFYIYFTTAWILFASVIIIGTQVYQIYLNYKNNKNKNKND